jgi:hypothetical protein
VTERVLCSDNGPTLRIAIDRPCGKGSSSPFVDAR